MKQILFISIISLLLLSSCNDDFLELPPTTKLGESIEFFETKTALETYTNSFYNYFDRSEILNDFYSDNCEHIGSPPPIRRGVYTIPTALGSGGWSWTQLRNINYFLDMCSKSKLSSDDKNPYIALARFFRAKFYFEKVKTFGDVPWYSRPLNTNDDELYKARDTRTMVMDSLLADLDFAIDYLPVAKSKNKITKWTALALKSRICLYEGTWRKYHTEVSLTKVNDLLSDCVDASKQIMDAGVYTLYSTGNPNRDYFELFQPTNAYTEEVILARSAAEGNYFYYTPNFTSTSNGNYGATYSLVSSYLMKNGQAVNPDLPDTTCYFDEFQNKDPRLAQSILYPGYIRVGTTTKAVTDFAENRTGYQIIKRVGPPIEDQGGDTRDAIMFRYAEVLLNYAEAKAELGSITQEDIDQSINLIRSRVALPPLTLPVAVDDVLDAMYLNTSDPIILEIRRERRNELAFEGFRRDDIKRWAEGHLFRSKQEGIYITGIHKFIDLDNDGNPDLYVLLSTETVPSNKVPGVQYFKLSDVNGLSNGTKGRIIPFNSTLPAFQNWEYLSPIPTEELTLNPKLEQNPGWDELY
ncbi:MAG: RagB/SusD family nutrient uptake outer membrane protein [Bacteroidales bacterium]|jgi:hypothetical protein